MTRKPRGGRRLALAAIAAFALLAAAAAAAPPWSAPQSVSSPSLFVDNPDVVFAGQGRAFATWREGSLAVGNAPEPQDAWRIAVREPGQLLFGAEQHAPNFATPLVPHGTEGVVALDTHRRTRGRISLRERVGDPQGRFGRPRTISTYGDTGVPPSLAGAGGTLAAWIAKASNGRRIVRAAVKSRGRFRAPFTLRGRGRANDVVAGQALGVMFVAWERAGVVEARVKLSGRRSWSRVQRLGRGEPFATSFRAVGSVRRAYLAWQSETAESVVVRAAALPVARTRFREAQTIETIEHAPPAERHPLALVTIPARDALVAWTGWDGARWRVRAAATGPGAAFGAPFDVSPAGENAVLGDVAAIPAGTRKPGGTVLAVWSRLDAVGEIGDRVRAAVRPPGGVFAAPEDVSDLDRARVPAVAFDFTLETWTAVWSQRIGPETPVVPQAQITTFARAATRPG